LSVATVATSNMSKTEKNDGKMVGDQI